MNQCLYDTVAMLASALAGAGGTFSAAVTDAFAGIAAAIEGAGINLTNKASVSALVTQVAQTEHLTLASGVADNVATLIVADNAALDQKWPPTAAAPRSLAIWPESS
jgi:hypothetical protein